MKRWMRNEKAPGKQALAPAISPTSSTPRGPRASPRRCRWSTACSRPRWPPPGTCSISPPATASPVSPCPPSISPCSSCCRRSSPAARRCSSRCGRRSTWRIWSIISGR